MQFFAATSEETLARLSAKEAYLRGRNDQASIATKHVLHGGMYCRTILLPSGFEIISVLVKLPTMVIVSGDCFVYLESGWQQVLGPHEVVPASAGRKQHFIANEDTHISMFFPSKARTVDKAEREFTDEFQNLLSRRLMTDDKTVITGE